MACCFILSKLILFFLDFLYVLIGIIILALGIWIVADGRSFFETVSFFAKAESSVMELYANTPVVTISAIVLIVIGGIILLLSFGGCWGVVSENQCLLITYATFMSLIVVAEVVCVILLFALQYMWQPLLNDTMATEFSKNYKGTMGAFNVSEYDPFSLAVDAFMMQFNCCGINGPDDFKNITTASLWYAQGRKFVGPGDRTYTGDEVELPTACCQFKNTTFFQDQQYSLYRENMNNDLCPVTPSDFKETSCLSIIPQEVDKRKVPLIVTPVIILVLQLICIGLASHLAVAIKRWGDELYY